VLGGPLAEAMTAFSIRSGPAERRAGTLRVPPGKLYLGLPYTDTTGPVRGRYAGCKQRLQARPAGNLQPEPISPQV